MLRAWVRVRSSPVTSAGSVPLGTRRTENPRPETVKSQKASKPSVLP
jgi:hypothetical protein